MSKGSWRRPSKISEQEFEDNWTKAFGVKPKKEKYKKWKEEDEEDPYYDYKHFEEDTPQ